LEVGGLVAGSAATGSSGQLETGYSKPDIEVANAGPRYWKLELDTENWSRILKSGYWSPQPIRNEFTDQE
jgi:hypothetical protein